MHEGKLYHGKRSSIAKEALPLLPSTAGFWNRDDYLREQRDRPDSQVRVAAGLRFASERPGAVGCGLYGLAQGRPFNTSSGHT